MELTKNCTGCMACYNKCPNNAISIVYNEAGFYTPQIDETKCTNCELCAAVCLQIKEPLPKEEPKVCYAVMTGDEIRKNSASGGVFALIAQQYLKKGGYVCGAAFSEDFRHVNHIIINDEKERLDSIVSASGLINNEIVLSEKNKEKNEIMRDLVINSDLFITYRPKFALHTIIAGFPWFLDWGRDALISFEGLLLVTKRYELAKEILLMFTRDIKYGLIPNGYSGFDSRPLYNSVDSSLLLFEQVQIHQMSRIECSIEIIQARHFHSSRVFYYLHRDRWFGQRYNHFFVLVLLQSIQGGS